MPTFSFSFSFHRPRFLRSRSSRSQTPDPSPAGPRHDPTAPSSLDLDPSQPSASRPTSRLRVPERGMDTGGANTGAPYSPGLRSFIDYQTSTGHPLDARGLDEFGGQPSLASRPVISRGIVPLNTVHLPNPYDTTSPLNPTDSLAPLHTPYPPMKSSEYALNSQYDFGGRPSPASRPVISMRTVPSNKPRLSNPYDFTSASNPADALHGSHSLAPLPSPYPPMDSSEYDFCGRPPPASHPVISRGIVLSNEPYLPNPYDFTSASNLLDPFQVSSSLALPPMPYSPSPSSRSSLNSQYAIESSGQYSEKPQYSSHGMFHEAHDLLLTGAFVDGNVGSVNINTSNRFMEKLLKETIPGASSDSSERDPPPRCHPGTRLAILDRCISFIHSSHDQKKMRWVVGAAGVGKSAVMQSVADSPELVVGSQASVFFSINGRNDGAKAVTTVSYQFAAKSRPYRDFIEKEITLDPSLLQSSMATQFRKLIVDPFVHDPQLNSAGRVLVIVDGLDECKSPRTQVELLRLISDLCIKHPSSPLVWLISSRPETHITSFLGRVEVMPAYEKEEIAVDSDEARVDVERFLRHELTEIKKGSDALDAKWPEEKDLWRLADASGGLFAHAQSVIRYIGDSTIGSPASQLIDVLNVFDSHPMADLSPEEHPMALLDALYARILSHVSPRIMVNTRKLLLALASNWNRDPKIKGNFIELCNWLGMTPEEAYAALNHLRSVLYVPRRAEAHRQKLQVFHKSFIDYICDFTRSGFSRDIEREGRQLITECTFRILKEASDGIDFGDTNYDTPHGCLVQGPGTGDNIALAWPVDKGVDWDDRATRLCLYKVVIGETVSGMRRGDSTFQSEFCIRLLIARFWSYHSRFPHYELRDFVFDESRRRELTKCGILKLIPIKEVDISVIYHEIKLQFRRSATAENNVSDPWNSSCKHARKGVWGGGREHNWTTMFWHSGCSSCFQRLKLQLNKLVTRSPDCSVPVLFTLTGQCCVEVRVVDLEDGMLEWTYWLWIRLPVEKRKRYGSIV